MENRPCRQTILHIQKNQKTAPSSQQSKQTEHLEGANGSISEMVFAREALPLDSILSFLGKDQYRFLAVNQLWRRMYAQKYGFSTSLLQVAISSSRATIFLEETEDDWKQHEELCKIAAGLGNISVLNVLKDHFPIIFFLGCWAVGLILVIIGQLCMCTNMSVIYLLR